MPVRREKRIRSIEGFVAAVKRDCRKWETSCPWFRGEPGNVRTPVLPGVFRPRPGGGAYDENHLLQQFRMKGPVFVPPPVPQRDDIDLWLFLAQHFGVPTRLLDWTEGSLIGLYFALLEDKPGRQKKPIVWMLNPTELNRLSAPDVVDCVFPLTWYAPQAIVNIGHINIRNAWELGRVPEATEVPVAIQPSYIHPRVSAQKSCFTVHGRNPAGLDQLVGPSCLKKYRIDFRSATEALRELTRMGISRSHIFPDTYGLAQELKFGY